MFSFRTEVSVAKTSGDIESSCKIIAEFQTNVLSSKISFTAGSKQIVYLSIQKNCQGKAKQKKSFLNYSPEIRISFLFLCAQKKCFKTGNIKS